MAIRDGREVYRERDLVFSLSLSCCSENLRKWVGGCSATGWVKSVGSCGKDIERL